MNCFSKIYPERRAITREVTLGNFYFCSSAGHPPFVKFAYTFCFVFLFQKEKDLDLAAKIGQVQTHFQAIIINFCVFLL